MNIIKAPIESVVPWDKNPRGIKTKDYDRLKKQITKLGVYKPLIAFKEDGKYIVLGGNMRIRALKEMGLKEVDVSIVEPKTEAQKIEFALSDNDRAGFYEEDKLAELVYPHIKDIDLGAFKVDLGEAIDLKLVVERYGPDIDDGADDVPEMDDTPAITKMGDLFTLGKHRLLCGDSTKAEDVARLMRGERADMVFTDPPYGINVVKVGGGGKTKFGKVGGGKWVAANYYRPIEGDDREFNPRFLLDLQCPKTLLFGGNYYAASLPNSRCWFTWDKTGENHVQNNFADCEYIWTNLDRLSRIYRCKWRGLIKAAGEDNRKRIHPTQKPLSLIAEIINDTSEAEEKILDPFLGSGTTLIAAEKLNRVCYGMEIDPKYCDVIIKRYADYVGVEEKAIRKTVEHGK